MRSRPTRTDVAAMLVVGAAMMGVVAFHRAAAFDSWSDENIHMYTATRVAAGERLYGTIHSARPPLVIFPVAGLIAAGTPPLVAVRSLQLAAILATALLLYGFALRRWGRREAVLSALVYLLSPAAVDTEFTGIVLVGLWTTACVVLMLRGRPAAAGLAGGIALATGQHAAVLVVGAAVGAAARGRRAVVAFVGAAVVVPILVVATVVALGGHAVFADLIGHHLYHLSGGDAPHDLPLWWWLAARGLEDAPMLALAACAPVLDDERGAPSVPLLGLAAAHVATVVLMSGGQIVYVYPAIPLLAIAAGRVLAIATGAFRDVGAATIGRRPAAALLVLTAVLAITGWAGAAVVLGTRDRRAYSLLPQRRHLEMRRLARPVVVDELAAAVAASGRGGTIFGHPPIATLLALKTGRRMAGELGDLDPRWLLAGTVSREEVVRRIELDGIELFVTPAWFFQRDPYFAAYLARCYAQPTVFAREPGSGIPSLMLYVRRDGTRPCTP